MAICLGVGRMCRGPEAWASRQPPGALDAVDFEGCFYFILGFLVDGVYQAGAFLAKLIVVGEGVLHFRRCVGELAGAGDGAGD